MIRCTVCGADNEDLSITCTKCHSYLQAKVDTIDLFSAFWGLIDHPARTLRKVVLAKQKNYVFILLMLQGIAISLAAISYWQLGKIVPYGLLIGAGFLGGPLVGILFALIATLLVKFVTRMLGGHGSARNLRAVLAYGAVPVVFLLVIVYPLEFGVFGQYLFDHNPPPSTLQPVAYIIFLALNGLGILWTVVLYGIGCAIACSISWWKGMVPAILVAALAIGGVIAVRWV